MALVAVFGASGRQGLARVRQLKAAGHQVRAISRRADPFHGEDFGEAELVPADLHDEDSSARALEGADAASKAWVAPRVFFVNREGHRIEGA